MSCPHEAFERMTAFAAMGQISEDERERLEAHLASCASCRMRLKQMTAASYAYFVHYNARSREEELPAEVRERFSRRLASLGAAPHPSAVAERSGSLRLAMAVLVFAILTPMVVRVVGVRRARSASDGMEIASELSVSVSRATAPGVFDGSRRLEAHTRQRRPRRLTTVANRRAGAREFDAAGEHLPYFRLERPEVMRGIYPRPFEVPPIPSFPFMEAGARSNAGKVFEVASLPTWRIGEMGDGGSALRFVPESDFACSGGISACARFRLPPLTENAPFTDASH